jgi:cytochrome c oxidase subunit 2
MWGAVPNLLATVFQWGNPPGVTLQSKQVQHLWEITYYIAIPVGAIVMGLIFWCAVRYREHKGEERIPPQIQYHLPLEALYTVVPIILVAVLFVYTYQAEDREDNVAPNPALIVRVDAFQWGWAFTYPNGYEVEGSVASEPTIQSPNLPVLTLPAGETVQINLFSDDVNHSFYVPAFLFKRDAIQGRRRATLHRGVHAVLRFVPPVHALLVAGDAESGVQHLARQPPRQVLLGSRRRVTQP